MKRKKKAVIFIGIILLSALLAAAFLKLNPHFLYVFEEWCGFRCRKISLEAVDFPNPGTLSLEAASLDDRIRLDQSLMLVNPQYPLDPDFVPSVSQYQETEAYMNSCMQEAYAALTAAVLKETGSQLYISSDFRSKEKQQELYEKDPSTATIVGASEHQTGLALDVYVPYYAGYGFIKTAAGQFVNSSCWEYGFIIRYPSYGKKSTGIKYEPWHLRYVGQPHAEIIYNNHLTLENYLQSLEIGKWYRIDGYLISRQELSEDSSLFLPADFEHAVISPDNTGAYIITIQEPI